MDITLHEFNEYLKSKTGKDYHTMHSFLAATLSNTLMFENSQGLTCNNKEDCIKEIASTWANFTIGFLLARKTNLGFLKGCILPKYESERERLCKELEDIKVKLGV